MLGNLTENKCRNLVTLFEIRQHKDNIFYIPRINLKKLYTIYPKRQNNLYYSN